MRERPIGPLVTALRGAGVAIEYLGTEGSLPLRVPGGGFPGGKVELAATVSSQYVSSVLIAAPCAGNPVTLTLVGEVVSATYITMTVELMKTFGVHAVYNEDQGTYSIPNSGYINPTELVVEPDASSASYPLAIAAITGGEVTVDGLGTKSLQGDARFPDILEQMGCTVEQTATSTTVRGPANGAALKAIDLDGDSADTFMTTAALMVIPSLLPFPLSLSLSFSLSLSSGSVLAAGVNVCVHT